MITRRENFMKISGRWPGNASKNKIKRVIRKPKIRWQALGLADPADKHAALSMDDIRREVATLSSRGFGQGARSRTVAPAPRTADKHGPAEGAKTRRRGATE